MTNVTNSPDDEFSAAFAELNTPSTPTAAAEAAPAASAEASPSAEAAAPAEATPAAAVPAEAGNEPAVADTSAAAAAESPVAAPASPSEPAEDWKTRYEELQRQHEAALRRAAPAAEPKPAEQPAAPAPAPIYNDSETAALAKYREDWPDVAAGEALQRRAEYQQLVNYVFDQLRPTLEALQATSERSSTRTQYQDIKELVSDYDSVRQPTLDWIETQPEYLKAAYRQVAETGSASDVADLINRFKKETGYVAATTGVATGAATSTAPAPTAAASAPAAAVAGAGLAPAAAAAVASLKVVKSSRSEPVSAPDPNDFDAAFAEFAKAG